MRKQCEGMMCGEMQCEGAFDEGNARASCSESSISTKKVAWGVMWKVMAIMALPVSRYSAFQYMAIVTSEWVMVVKIFHFQYMVIIMLR